MTDCSGTCANLKTDNTNCGACATACKAGQVCSSGTCALSCQSGLTDCSGTCTNTASDSKNCGACATACLAGQVCSSGKCVLSCQSGLTDCSGTCTNLAADVSSCGNCGNACKKGQVCSSGKCTVSCQSGLTDCSGTCADLQTSLSHCGACGTACKNPALCVAGKCTLFCKTGQTECNGACVDLSTDANNCGTCGGTCPAGVTCAGGSCGLASCRAILAATPTAKSGVYTIKPGTKAFAVYCDMTTSPGGWTLLGTQVAGMSSSTCTSYWTSGAPGRYTPTPMPGSSSGTTTRFPFAEWNAIAATNPAGAFKATSSLQHSYISYWKASCKITSWDTGTAACYQDFTDYACTKARRASTYNPSHGVLQGYNGHGGYSDAHLSYTSFQTCTNTPAVGYHNGSGTYSAYKHNAGLMLWFR